MKKRTLLATLVALLVVSMVGAPFAFADDLDEVEEVAREARFAADVYLLMDSTGSMTPSIDGMSADAADLLSLDDDIPEVDVQFGAGDFKDFQSPTQRDPYAFNHGQSITDDTAAVRAVIDGWSASGGWDLPEAHFYAYDQLAENRAPAWGDHGADAPGRPEGTIGWRDGAKRIVVAMADVGGHDYTCSAITAQVPGHEVDYDITEASVTAKFEARNMTLIAISAPTGPGMDEETSGSDYDTACGAGASTFAPAGFTPGAGASAEQATRMTTATGGRFLEGVGGDEIVEAVRAATTEVIDEIEEDLSPTFDRGITQACDPTARADAGFADISGVSGPIQQAINCLAFYEISQGTTPTTYAPGAEVQRVDMAVFLARLIDYAEANTDLVVPPVEDQGFTDIADLSTERRNAVNLLGTLEVTGGTGDGTTFSPFASVTRRDMASFLVRVQNVLEEDSYETDERFFTDVAEELPRADDINALAAQGIVQGVAEGRYGPFRPVLRSQMALFIMRHVDENVEADRLPAKTAGGAG